MIVEALNANDGATILTIVGASVIAALGLVWTLDRAAYHR